MPQPDGLKVRLFSARWITNSHDQLKARYKRDLIHMGLLKFFDALKELKEKIFHKESYAFNATQKQKEL